MKLKRVRITKFDLRNSNILDKINRSGDIIACSCCTEKGEASRGIWIFRHYIFDERLYINKYYGNGAGMPPKETTNTSSIISYVEKHYNCDKNMKEKMISKMAGMAISSVEIYILEKEYHERERDILNAQSY